MRLPFLKNYRRLLLTVWVWVACFAVGFVAGAWMGRGATGMADRRTAAGPAVSSETASSEDATTAKGLPAENTQARAESLGPEADGGFDTQVRQPETMVIPARGRTVGEYGWYRDAVMDDWRFRDGLDILCAAGTDVVAVLSGTVAGASRAQDSGYSVSLKHAGGLSTTYSNLRSVWVDVGQKVAVGSPLGDIGAASSASGQVLRFTVECDGQSQDPAVCLGQRF